MRADVVAIGTELLLGQIIDTNSAWIGEHLALAGIDTHQQVKVGDNIERIVSAISDALDRSDAVICCGGLGPTQDDLTRQAIAQVMGVELEFDPDKADLIRHMFGSRGRNMPDNNLLQAYRPSGSEFISEQPGTAPGLVCPVQRMGPDGVPVEKVIFAVPGVPWEMREMMEGTVIPALRARSGDNFVIRSRTLRTWGQSESGLAEILAERITELDALGNPTLAFLASGIEGLKVRITSKAPNDADADAILNEEETRIRRMLGGIIFGVDDDTMESVVLSMLEAKNLTLGVAESVTGGLISARLVAIDGASKVFLGGVVSYATSVKQSVLGVPDIPVISCECAEAMARGVRAVVGSDVGIGVTGIAGPDPVEGQPPGTVCLAVDVLGDVASVELRLPGRRQQVREFSCITVLDMLRARLVDD